MKNINSQLIFNNNLKKCMSALGVTQAKLSKLCGVDYSTVCRWYNGSRGITLETLDKISKSLKIEPSKMLNPNLTIEVKVHKKIKVKI
jgi:transcriptional regulator with XRE-family HTH domain